jgi:hypothetical protein
VDLPTGAIIRARGFAGDSTHSGWFVESQLTNAPAPDLVVAELNVPTELALGAPATISWTILNRGRSPATSEWLDRLYLSPDVDPANGWLVAEFPAPDPLSALADEDSRQKDLALVYRSPQQWRDGMERRRSDAAAAAQAVIERDRFERFDAERKRLATPVLEAPAAWREAPRRHPRMLQRYYLGGGYVTLEVYQIQRGSLSVETFGKKTFGVWNYHWDRQSAGPQNPNGVVIRAVLDDPRHEVWTTGFEMIGPALEVDKVMPEVEAFLGGIRFPAQ